jgi:antitoxin MazE
MQVSKWGNSLAIRIPSTVVDALKLKEGDEVVVRIAGERDFEVGVDRTREMALQRIKSFA